MLMEIVQQGMGPAADQRPQHEQLQMSSEAVIDRRHAEQDLLQAAASPLLILKTMPLRV